MWAIPLCRICLATTALAVGKHIVVASTSWTVVPWLALVGAILACLARVAISASLALVLLLASAARVAVVALVTLAVA